MVAYSFMARFAPLVQSGEKLHTVREDKHNGRHAKRGSSLQLFEGQRTPSCRTLREATCRAVHRIDIDVTPDGPIVAVWFGDTPIQLTNEEVEMFAIADGFQGSWEICEFFAKPCDRVLILWGYPEWFWVVRGRYMYLMSQRLKTLAATPKRSDPTVIDLGQWRSKKSNTKRSEIEI